MRKPFLKSALMGLAGVFFLLCALLPPQLAKAEFSPAGIKIIATLKGQWRFKDAYYSGKEMPRAPVVDFSSGYNNILINFDGKLPPFVQDSLNIALGSNFFGCNGEDFRLWFNNGDYIPLEVGRCERGRVYLHIPIGTGEGLWANYRKLASFLQKGNHPVVLSESMVGIKLSYSDDTPLKAFKNATDPKTNPAYFAAIHNYWSGFSQKHSVDVLSKNVFVPLDTEVIGSLKGEWQIKQDGKLFPGDLPPHAVVFNAGPMMIAISLASTANDFLDPNGIIVRDYLNMSLCSLYFKCNTGAVKLWFDNGDYVETGPAMCLGDGIYATSSKGRPNAREAEMEKKLAELMKTQRPVAISQGKYAVSLDYLETKALDEFRRYNDPKRNTAYFRAKKKYYQQKADVRK